METPQPDQHPGLRLAGVSAAVLLCADDDAAFGARLKSRLETTGAGCFVHPALWARQAGPQLLGAYACLLYVMENNLPDPVASVEAFRKIVQTYRQARSLRLPDLIAGDHGPHEVGLVQLFAPMQLTCDSPTRRVLQGLADRLHTREHDDPDPTSIYRPRQRLPPVSDASPARTTSVYLPSGDVAEVARSRLRRQGVRSQAQADRALQVLRGEMARMDDPRFRLARRPVPGKGLNALRLALTDPAPLLDQDGIPLYRGDPDRNRLQDTLNRAVGQALKALRQEPGLESVRLENPWGGRVKAMYDFHRDLGIVAALGMD